MSDEVIGVKYSDEQELMAMVQSEVEEEVQYDESTFDDEYDESGDSSDDDDDEVVNREIGNLFEEKQPVYSKLDGQDEVIEEFEDIEDEQKEVAPGQSSDDDDAPNGNDVVMAMDELGGSGLGGARLSVVRGLPLPPPSPLLSALQLESKHSIQ